MTIPNAPASDVWRGGLKGGVSRAEKLLAIDHYAETALHLGKNPPGDPDG